MNAISISILICAKNPNVMLSSIKLVVGIIAYTPSMVCSLRKYLPDRNQSRLSMTIWVYVIVRDVIGHFIRILSQ